VNNWIKDRLKYNFSNKKFIRKFIGGYWECWYIDICHCDIWFNISKEQLCDFRPGCGHGTPYCEYYPIGFFDYKTNYTKENILRLYRKVKLERVCQS